MKEGRRKNPDGVWKVESAAENSDGVRVFARDARKNCGNLKHVCSGESAAEARRYVLGCGSSPLRVDMRENMDYE
jgi:hypothetical protein